MQGLKKPGYLREQLGLVLCTPGTQWVGWGSARQTVAQALELITHSSVTLAT